MSGVREGLNTNNAFFFFRGRAALYAILKAVGVAPGDEILLQAFTCMAVPAPIVALGARPVYADIDRKTFNMDPSGIERSISGRTKAVIVQHTFGIPSDMTAILAVARKRGLAVIEDCCHAFGSRYRGQEIGTFGDAAFHSFEWGKPVTIGLGGTAIVNSEPLRGIMERWCRSLATPSIREDFLVNAQYAAHRLLRNPSLYWRVRDAYRFLSKAGIVVGTFREEEFEGKENPDFGKAMLSSCRRRLFAELPELDDAIEQRRRIASRYEEWLRAHGFPTVETGYDCRPVFLKYPLLFRDKPFVLAKARECRVDVSDIFASPIHPLSEGNWRVYGYEKGMCPAAEEVSKMVVSLPIHTGMGEKRIEKIFRFVKEVAGNLSS